jgi:hypothetical protein
MYYVLLASHTPDVCPTSNAKMKEMLLKRGPEIPDLARRLGVKIIAGPLVNREHLAVVVVETAKAETLDQFISESGLAQWNRVRVLPSQTLEEGMKEVVASKSIF